MPAKKPQSLISRHETAEEKAARAEGESRLRPEKTLPKGAPARLKDFPIASETWRRIMKTYNSLEGEIVTLLDYDLLLSFCILMEQLSEIDAMRKDARENWQILLEQRTRHLKDNEFDQAVLMAKAISHAYDTIVKLDTRADRKRSLIMQQMQSLYLTPRARAGFVPGQKEEEAKGQPVDELEELFSDVDSYLNGGSK